MQINIHGFELSDAIIEVIYALKEATWERDSILEIIHGFHHGTVLKSFFQSQKFIQMMKKENFHLSQIKSDNPAISRFKILKSK